MSKPTELTTFTFQLDQLLRGETIPDETPELAFARRLRAVDLASRSRSETSLRAYLLSSKNSSTFPQTPINSPHRNSLPSRLAPTLAFGAAMVLLVLFLAWVLTNTTPQPAVPEAPTKGFSLLVLDYQGVVCCGEGRAEWLDAETLQTSKELNIPFARGIIASPDGKVIFDQGYGAETEIFSLDLVTGQQTALVTSPEILATQGNYPIPFAISPDGTRLVVAHYDSVDTITRYWRSVFNLTTNTLLYKLPEEPEYVHLSETPSCLGAVLMISPDSNYLYELCISSGLPRIRMIDLNSGEVVGILPVLYAWGAELSPDGSLMYVLTTLGDILVLNTQNLETLKTFEFESLVADYAGGRRTAISQDGMTLFVSTYALTGKHKFFAMDTQSGEMITQIEGDGSIDSIVVTRDNQTVFTLALLEDGKAVVTAHDPVTLEAKYRRVFEGEFIPKRLLGVVVDAVTPVVESSTVIPPSSPTPTHEATTDDPLTILQTLTGQYANDILSGSGWLHLRTRQFVNDEPGTFPNGALIPNPAIWDDWYQFDDQLQVLYEVNLYMDENGNVNQASIQRDGQSYNLTLGFSDTPSPFNPNFDLDFTERAANLIAEGETLNMSDFYFEGQYIGLMFSIRQGDTEWEAVFNPDTGAMLSYTVYQLAAGGKTIQNVMTMLVQEWVAEPPADILVYLDQELKPYAPLPPLGTSAPEGFDASSSDLTFKWIYGDDINVPTFFYMDVYAEDYLLGRFDSGGVPGGFCDRSFDGAYIAFNYQRPEPDYLTTIRWFNVNEISNVLEPFPALQQNSPPSFAPQDLRMAFGACEAGNCGYYIYNLQTGELTKITDGPAYASPAWTPDGNYLVYLIPAGSENTDLKQGEVIRADTGEVVFTGTTNEILQKYDVTVPTGASGLSCERAPDTSPDTQPVLNPDGTYTVQDGDTLSQIAADFGLTVETLIALNGLSPEAPAIFPGMVLIVVPFDPANLRFPAQAVVKGMTDGKSNLRSGPGAGYEVIEQIQEGSATIVLEVSGNGDWYKIFNGSLPDGTAWIYKDFLTITANPPLEKLKNDLVITNFRRSGDSILADACFTVVDFPDWESWMIWYVVTTQDGKPIGGWVVPLTTEYSKLENEVRIYCNAFMLENALFDTGEITPETQFTMSVQTFRPFTFPEEGCESYLSWLQQVLEAEQTGIQVKCVQDNPGWHLEIIAWPSSMTQEQATTYIYDGEPFAVHGEWIFHFTFEN